MATTGATTDGPARDPGRAGRAAATAGSPLAALPPVDRSTRREQILARLRAAVSTGALPPGTHLAEVELAESLGVSRGTLREALRHLQQEGLLVQDSRGRLSVRRVTAREVADIFAVRAALEALAAESLCARDDRMPAVAELRRRVWSMQEPGLDLGERVTRDLMFHETLCTASGNAVLHASWLHVSGLARAAITAAGAGTALANTAGERHVPIVDLIERGDGVGVRAFLVEHMSEAAEQLIAHMSGSPTNPDT